MTNPDAVRRKTLIAVRVAATELGYIPNASGRALASRRSMMIGVVLPTLDNPVYAAFVHNLQKTLIGSGYQLLALSHDYDRTIEHDLISRLIGRGVDAVILIGTDHDPETIALLDRTSTPYLFSWSSDEAPTAGSIGFSNRTAMSSVINHLYGLGHRVIAMLSGSPLHNERARGRLVGAHAAMAEMGLTLAAVVTVPLTIVGGRAGFGEALIAAPQATALVCTTDTIAAGALAAARDAGVRVPQDMSITGFDDIDLAEVVSPPLTTIRIPIAEIAAGTGTAIVAMLGGDATPLSRDLATCLVVRASSGPPPVSSSQ